MPRPPVLTVRKLISVSPDLVQRIEDFRFARRIKAEAEAIRFLIERGLAVETAIDATEDKIAAHSRAEAKPRRKPRT